jgi:hypothetical protein
VAACDPGRLFAFEVKPRLVPVQAWWEYRFETNEPGCRVIETVEDRRTRIGGWIGNKISGVRDRAERNRETMTETLRRLAEVAEASGPGSQK